MCLQGDVIYACFSSSSSSSYKSFQLYSHVSILVLLSPPSLFFHSLFFTRTRIHRSTTSLLFKHPGGRAILLKHSGVADATGYFEKHEHSAATQMAMQKYLVWDPSVCLGKLGTILGLFKLVAFPSIYSLYPNYPVNSVELPPGIWSELQVRRPPSLHNRQASSPMETDEEDYQKGEVPHLLTKRLSSALLRYWLIDDRRHLSRGGYGLAPEIVKLLKAKRFWTRERGELKEKKREKHKG